MYTVTPDTIKYADSLAVKKYGIPELTLMKYAAKSCYDVIISRIKRSDKIAILCGKGNNGGDGYEIARLLKQGRYDVCCINVFGTNPDTQTANEVFKDFEKTGEKIYSLSQSKQILESADVIIDAVFGVGFHGKIEDNSDYGKLFLLCNSLNSFKIAIDTPSGINSLDGSVEGVSFKADITLTMAYIKTGMLSYPAREFCGEIQIMDIGYPKALNEEIEKDALIVDKEYVERIIPKRQSNTHKGSYGRLMMLCASEFMTGACVLAATSALRTGVGLVEIIQTQSTLAKLQNNLVEPVFTPIYKEDFEKSLDIILEHSKKASAFLIGCGLSRSQFTDRLVFEIIKNVSCPLIIDADGINALSLNRNILKEAKATPILTPHPLEFARLSGIDIHNIQNNRINVAKSFAKEYDCIVVLKGAGTVIASPDGRLCINTSGNPGLSKGGSGDVLSGMIASFTAQGFDLFDACCVGVYLHGLAGDILKEQISEYGYIPSDIPMCVAKLLP